jgi:hypothetical protein
VSTHQITPPGHRGVARDERPPWDDGEEPPHLQGGSPHDDAR